MELAFDRSSMVARARGSCASPGQAIGRARVVREKTELSRLLDGEVAVLRCAWAEASAVLDRVSAVVTERGGVLCSLGTLTREWGGPCIVGAAGVTESVPDGELVFVDADAGVLVVLDPVVALPI